LPLPPLPPLGAAPQPWASGMIGSVPGRSHLPPAVIGREPRRGEAARQQSLRPRAAADLPTLAWRSGISPPTAWLTPAGPLAHAPSPDAARLVPPWRSLGPDPDRAGPTSDPTLEPAGRAELAVIPELAHQPVPFLRLAIPDPFEQATTVRLRDMPPDEDSPAPAFELPPKAPMPTGK
jgi:hypothetical protein